MTLRIRYLGPFAAETGLAAAAHDYLLALYRTDGVELDIDPILPGTDLSKIPARYSELRSRIGAEADDWPNIYIIHTIPPYLSQFVADEFAPPGDALRVANTVWETQPLPRSVGRDIQQSFNRIFVPSRFNRDAFVVGGVQPEKISVVPHCYDPDFWIRAVPRRSPAQPYTFYAILVWAERKNPIGLLKAYLTEFTAQDDVLLRIVTPGYSREDVEVLKQATLLPNLPPVEFIGMVPKRLSDEEIWNVHATGDCYVSTTRGEAWGLGMFEAALFGNPVIAPQQGGQTDFLDLYPYTLYYSASMTPAISPDQLVPGIIAADQWWAEPDLATCRKLMRRAYKSRLKKEPFLAAQLRAEYTYEAIGSYIKDILEKAL